MRLLRSSITAIACVALGALAACDTASAPTLAPRATTPDVVGSTPTIDLGAQIRSMIESGFPKGHANAINAKWNQVLKALAKNERQTLKGKNVPAAAGRSELTRTLAFIQSKSGEATPPAGETAEHFVARLALYMSLYVYGGPDTQPPPLTSSSDVAYKVVQPTVTDTVVTPAQQAAVVFPAGAVSEPTVVVITPITTPYPANCSGPLDTHLCQYPLFYKFNVFPDVKLSTPAHVQVCHVDAGVNRLPLADHDRFRFAHDRPLDPSDYSAGSTIVDNAELLQSTPMLVTSCPANGGTVYAALPPATGPLSPFGRIADAAARAAHRAAFEVKRAFTPREVYAIDAGVGALTEMFSTFDVVDPASTPDIAQSLLTGSRFSVGATTAHPGDVISIPSWSVVNAGSGTSAAYSSTVNIATDSLMSEPIVSLDVGGGSVLVPNETHAYPATSVTLPATLSPGSYFVGTRVFPIGADSNAADNRISVRITVTALEAALPDLAVGANFSFAPRSVLQGGSVLVNRWSVSNIGLGNASNIAGAWTILATDTALAQVADRFPVSLPTSIAAGAGYTAGAITIPVSHCQAPGAYFLGVQLIPVPQDPNKANDWTSQRLTIEAEPAVAGQTPSSQPWSADGPGSLSTVLYAQCARLIYNHNPSSLSPETFTYTTTAASSGPYTFAWTYSGLHSWYQATAGLEAFSVNADGFESVVTLVPANSYASDGFSFRGTATVQLTNGQPWGVRAHGSHFDSSLIMSGQVTISAP